MSKPKKKEKIKKKTQKKNKKSQFGFGKKAKKQDGLFSILV